MGTVFVLSAVMMGAKFYIDRNVQREDVRPSCLLNTQYTVISSPCLLSFGSDQLAADRLRLTYQPA